MAKRETIKREVTSSQVTTETVTAKQVSKNPLVFISHDTRDAELAEAFSELLINSSMGILESFRSSDKKGTQGIEYGTLWYDEIFKKLNEASDVVCLLTHNSVDRPWILYEAGIAIGKSGTPLIGIALGIPLNKANNGPFAQFQNCADDIDSLTKLVSSLVRKIPNAKPIDSVINGQVVEFLNKIKVILENQNEVSKVVIKENPLVEDTQVAKLFEEIKIMFQDLPSRIDRNVNSEEGNRKLRKLHPMLLEDIMHFSEDKSIGFIMVLSIFKNDLPWVYEFGMETLKEIKAAKSMKEIDIILMNFGNTLETSLNNPAFQELMRMMKNKEDYRIYRELPHMLEKALRRMYTKHS